MKTQKLKRNYSLVVALVAIFVLNGCSKQPVSIDHWKAWVLTRAKVEDYTAMDLVFQFVDTRTEKAEIVDYFEKYEAWWNGGEGNWPKEYEDSWVSLDDRIFQMEEERKDFSSYYYPVLAKLTLINALYSNEEDQDEEDITDVLALQYLRMMGDLGDNIIMSAFLEAADEGVDLNNLRKLTRIDLKKNMEEVLDDHGFSLYKTVLKTDDGDDAKWWGADNVARLAFDFQDEFFENVMALLGDFSELEQMIDETVGVYSFEYNSKLSSNMADVYDVIYSIKDKMYVKCSILEVEERSEIKIVNKSTHLLSL